MLTTALAISPMTVAASEASAMVLSVLDSLPAQPVADVPAYLATRKPQPEIDGEESLLGTLPKLLQEETRALVRACKYVAALVREDKWSVQRACVEAIRLHRKWFWNLKTFRAKFDEWIVKRDWVVLVNRAKAPIAWRKGNSGLPAAFIEFCAKRFAQFKRDDGKRQALISIKRQWTTGRNDFGDEEIIPGYESNWKNRQREIHPPGWSYSNIVRQMKKRAAFTRAHQAMAHEGTAAAKKHLPEVHGTRASLRFMEVVEFDDVKTDFRVIDTATGQICDLWLLIARDKATGMLLGFGMRPARAREDGSQEHLKLRDMKQLCGWLLETYGLPPYLMIWVIEHGTATLSEGTAKALAELIGAERIRVRFSSMQGKKSPVGYDERRNGNSQAKASLESHNRIGHTIGSNLPGQTGPHYGKRPTDLISREKEAAEIWRLAQYLPEHLRGNVEYPLLTIQQARQHLFRIFGIQNHRTEHALEGFERIAEWFDGERWLPQSTAPAGTDFKVRVRMEKPIERAARLCNGLTFTRISPAIITTFYEHTQRTVVVQDNGEIEFSFEGKKLYFRNAGAPLAPETSALAYFHSDDPRFIHLTDGRGALLGTWVRRALVDDKTAVAEAIRYSTAAFNIAKTYSDHLASDEREKLETMRARNAEVMQFGDFVEVTGAGNRLNEKSSPVASAFVTTRQENKNADRQRAEDERIAREALKNLSV